MLAEQDADTEGIEVPGIGRIQMTEESSESVVQSDLPLVPGINFYTLLLKYLLLSFLEYTLCMI